MQSYHDKQDNTGLQSFDYFYFFACHMLERKKGLLSTIDLKEGLWLQTFIMIAAKIYPQLCDRETKLMDLFLQRAYPTVAVTSGVEAPLANIAQQQEIKPSSFASASISS